MNETIGVKGGHNDRLRSLRISNARKKKLQEYDKQYIKQLEKKVQRQQKYTLIKTIPLVVVGTIVQSVFDTGETGKKENEEKKCTTLPTGEKVTLHIPKKQSEEKDELFGDTDVKSDSNTSKRHDITDYEQVKKTSPIIVESSYHQMPKKSFSAPKISVGFFDEPKSDIVFKDVDFNSLGDDAKEKLSKLRTKKIVEYYEDKLKEIRYDLRRTIYDYNVLVYDEDGIVLSKDADTILEKLNELISRIEELRKKLDVEDLDRYDDNYIYVLIEDYINDFRDKKILKEIQDSPLYILISDKLDELEEKRDIFSKKVEEKQEALVDKEEDFEDLENRYANIEKINSDLRDIQLEQERMLASLRERVANSTTEFERVTYEMQAMDKARTRMLRLLMFQMFLPGPNHAKSLAISTVVFLRYLNYIYASKYTEKKFRIIQVEDYSRDIENSISAIGDASKSLGKITSQIDKMQKEIMDKYGDYIGVLPECDRIISSLKRIKLDIAEKEEEMKRLKKSQEELLEKNNAKVLTKGEYPVN